MTRQESLCLTALVEAVAQDYADILANQAHQRKGIQTMKNPPLLFLDIECLGLDVEAPIWDLGAILLNGRNEVHPGKSIDVQILHNPTEGGRDCDNTLKCVVPMQLSRLETCE